jgi:hypothetical protein
VAFGNIKRGCINRREAGVMLMAGRPAAANGGVMASPWRNDAFVAITDVMRGGRKLNIDSNSGVWLLTGGMK